SSDNARAACSASLEGVPRTPARFSLVRCGIGAALRSRSTITAPGLVVRTCSTAWLTRAWEAELSPAALLLITRILDMAFLLVRYPKIVDRQEQQNALNCHNTVA